MDGAEGEGGAGEAGSGVGLAGVMSSLGGSDTAICGAPGYGGGPSGVTAVAMAVAVGRVLGSVPRRREGCVGCGETTLGPAGSGGGDSGDAALGDGDPVVGNSCGL